MNMKEEALALADYLDNNVEAMLFTEQPHLDRASAMIRRLVEELDRNKIYIQKMEDALGCDVSYYEPLNKPVNPFAWVDDCFSFFTDDDYSMLDDELKEGMIPLYTHPQTKPLSDEEIMEIFKAYEQMQEYGYVGKKPFQVHLGWSLEDKNSCLMLARAIEERHGIK